MIVLAIMFYTIALTVLVVAFKQMRTTCSIINAARFLAVVIVISAVTLLLGV